MQGTAALARPWPASLGTPRPLPGFRSPSRVPGTLSALCPGGTTPQVRPEGNRLPGRDAQDHPAVGPGDQRVPGRGHRGGIPGGEWAWVAAAIPASILRRSPRKCPICPPERGDESSHAAKHPGLKENATGDEKPAPPPLPFGDGRHDRVGVDGLAILGSSVSGWRACPSGCVLRAMAAAWDNWLRSRWSRQNTPPFVWCRGRGGRSERLEEGRLSGTRPRAQLSPR